MAKLSISITSTFSPRGEEQYIGLNKNTDPADKVQAFVDCFAPAAENVSRNCYGLHAQLILAQWGAESGWGSAPNSQFQQNWGGLKGGRQPGSKPEVSKSGSSMFYGINTFQNAYLYILKNVGNYSLLLNYLRFGNYPSVEGCIKLMASSGYCAGNKAVYEKLLTDCVATLNRRSNFKG